MGFVGFLVPVVGLHRGFGLLAAILVLSVIVIPYITKSVESSLGQVPVSYREGAEALGIPEMWTLRKIVLKSAAPGIIIGRVIVAISRRNAE
jgi:phosphate transport system permease protein